MRKAILIIAVAMMASACNWCELERNERNVVLMYISCHSNGLSAYSETQIEEYVNGGLLPRTSDYKNIFLLYTHLYDKEPELCRYSQDSHGDFIKEVIGTYPSYTKSVEIAQIGKVLADATAAFPSAHMSLILSSHASSFLPAGNKTKSAGEETFAAVNAFGPDDNVETDIQDLKKAFSPYHFDCMIFDCCYMAGVEVYYELKDMTDYMIGSANEVMAAGLFRNAMIPLMFERGNLQNSLTEVCKVYMNLVRTDYYYSNSGMISLVKTSELDEVAAQTAAIYDRHHADIAALNRSSVQKYRGNADYQCLYDFGDFIRHIADDDELQAFNDALGKAVIFKDSTPEFQRYAIKEHSGMSTYIPIPERVSLNNFYKTLAWNEATGLIQ